MIGFGSLGDPLLIARASAGVLSVLRQTFDGSPTVVVNVTAAGITAPVAIENAAGGGGCLRSTEIQRRRLRPPLPRALLQ